jgi:hypothetical protein
LPAGRETIGLCMIVRDEAAVIEGDGVFPAG